jgi:hypothetical protein
VGGKTAVAAAVVVVAARAENEGGNAHRGGGVVLEFVWSGFFAQAELFFTGSMLDHGQKKSRVTWRHLKSHPDRKKSP